MNPVRRKEAGRALFLLACLTIGNYCYAAWSDTVDVTEAAERSFFQASALFFYVSLWRRDEPKEIYG